MDEELIRGNMRNMGWFWLLSPNKTLLKASQSDQTPPPEIVKDKKPDRISEVIRYRGWGILVKLTCKTLAKIEQYREEHQVKSQA